jgi:hypothetical protein
LIRSFDPDTAALPANPFIDEYTRKWLTQMAKSLTGIRSLARSHTRTALNVLVRIMRSKDATAAARVSAANAILDRGWGKAPQAIQNGDSALELIHRIERVIVHPENPDSEDL